MKSGYIEKPLKAYYKEAEEPQIQKDTDVKIRVKVTGICGSEVHAYHGTHPFRIPPLVSGHEFSGEIVELGSAVTSYRIGDRVTAEPHFGCGTCKFCKEGNYNICTKKSVLGAGGWSGSLGEYVVVPESTVIPLTSNISFEQGALIEPIAVGMHAVRKTEVKMGQHILIIGAGAIGLGVFLSARLANPRSIIVADVVEHNLNIAKEMGCAYVVNSAKENLEERIAEITDGEGVDITFLAFGNAPVADLAAKCTKSGGIISEIALIADGTAFFYAKLQRKELKVMGSNMYVREDFELVRDGFAKGLLNDANKMISRTYPIESMQEAMIMADTRPEPVIKVLMTFN